MDQGCRATRNLTPRLVIVGRNTRSLQPSPIARPTLGKKQPQRQHDRDFASRKRQRHQRLAIGGLASAEAYCGATPTECAPFLGIEVSSITSTASLPPTSLSDRTSSSVSTGPASQTPA